MNVDVEISNEKWGSSSEAVGVPVEQPADSVLVFIVSKHANPTRARVLWRVSQADAMKICSDPRTAGARHMLCWTAHEGVRGRDWAFAPDSGRNAAVLAEHAVTVLEDFHGTPSGSTQHV